MDVYFRWSRIATIVTRIGIFGEARQDSQQDSQDTSQDYKNSHQNDQYGTQDDYGLQKDGQNSQYCGQNSSQDDQYSQDIQEDKHFYFDPKRLTEAQCCKRQL